jgi:two-component system, OmpR family, response regulator MprA
MPRVLLADDDTGFREALQEALAMDGHDVSVAGSVEEACEVALSRPIDVVVSDINMPGDGSTMPQRLRGVGRALPVIMITGFDEASVRERAEASGAVAYLVKPVSLAALRRALIRAVDGTGS